MYQVDRRAHRHKRLTRIVLAVLVILVIGLVLYLLFHIQITPKQEIRNTPPVSTAYKASEVKKVLVDKPELKLELLAGWKEISYEKSPTAPKYGFRNPETARQLEIYIDNPPVNMAINILI